MGLGNDWVDRAACKDHETLRPDAWTMVKGSGLRDEGYQALAVCQRSCPVKMKCRNWFLELGQRGPLVEIIVGGGWWTSKGIFRVVLVEEARGENPFRPKRKPSKVRSVAIKEEEELQPELAA